MSESVSVPLHIAASLEEGVVELASRFTFTINSKTGVSRTFIVDVPHVESGGTDVWVSDSVVMVGDTPEDGFATFTPAN